MRNTVLACALSAALGGAVTHYAFFLDPTPTLQAQEPRLTAPAQTTPSPAILNRLTAEERINVGVYESTNRGVVNISTKSVRNDNLFFLEIPSEGAGSGSVLDRQGHILTNFHVVDGARQIQVTLASGNTYPAMIVGKDPASDVAVLRIDAPAEELLPIPLGDSTGLLVGQKVYAIGNPFGLERTLTVGIISSLNRSIPGRGNRVMKSIIQVDAAMNPGNSGGPLLDTSGKVIGMNTAIASRTGQNTGVGFVIPVNRIKRIVPELIEKGFVTRPDAGIARVLETERGLLIASLTPGGAAEQAGLRGFRVIRRTQRQGLFTYESQTIDRSAADLIVAVDGEPVRKVDDFLSLLDEKQPGDRVTLTVVRDGEQVAIPLVLGASEP